MTGEAERLSDIRKLLRMASADWFSERGDDGTFVYGRDDEGTLIIGQTCGPNHADHTLMEQARTNAEFLIGLIDRASNKIRQLQAEIDAEKQQGQPKDYAANCAIASGKPAFKKFLQERHGLDVATDEATAAKVRELLGIASRVQLNTDPTKAALWKKLNGEFEAWART